MGHGYILGNLGHVYTEGRGGGSVVGKMGHGYTNGNVGHVYTDVRGTWL